MFVLRKSEVILEKCPRLYQRTSSGTAWPIFSVQLHFVLFPNLVFCNPGLMSVFFIYCFLNLQSKSYNLTEDIRKPAIGSTSLSADEPVSTLFNQGWKGHHAVAAHVAVVSGGCESPAVHKGNFSVKVKTGTGKLGKTGGVSFCWVLHLPKSLPPLTFQKWIYLFIYLFLNRPAPVGRKIRLNIHVKWSILVS